MLNCLQSSGLLPFLNSYLWWQKMEKTVKCGILVDMPVPRTREWLLPCPSFLGTDVFPNGLWLIDQKCLSSVVIVTQEFFYWKFAFYPDPIFQSFLPCCWFSLAPCILSLSQFVGGFKVLLPNRAFCLACFGTKLGAGCSTEVCCSSSDLASASLAVTEMHWDWFWLTFAPPNAG